MKHLPPNAILTQEKAREIRAKSQGGMNMEQLAKGLWRRPHYDPPHSPQPKLEGK